MCLDVVHFRLASSGSSVAETKNYTTDSLLGSLCIIILPPPSRAAAARSVVDQYINGRSMID